MKRTLVQIAGAVLALLSVQDLYAYKPAENPLMTTWGEKITPKNAWRLYPRPQLVRQNWQNLNGLWQYAVCNRELGEPGKWQGEILVPFSVESALSGVKRLVNADEQIWYRRNFKASLDKGKERMLLHFGAVDFRTQVFVNGIEVTDVPHDGGLLPFSIDITDAVKEGENVLTVSVWDPTDTGNRYGHSLGKQTINPQGCFYTRVSGIWQTVWTEKVPATHITGYQVVTDIDKGNVDITLKTAGNLMGASAEIEIWDGQKQCASGKVQDWNRPVRFTLPSPRLWSPESPNLYSLHLKLNGKGCDTDSVTGYFGMRKIECKKDEKGVPRFYLNNKKCYMHGPLDQGWWPDGLLTPPSEEAMAFEINFLKKAGFNMLRKHIKVEPLRYYALCDRLGILVWQDMASGGGNRDERYTLYRQELKGMIDLLQAIPSIVMWVPYNEAWGQPQKAKTNMTLNWVKRYDPTRLVNGPSGWTDYGVGDAKDMHRYPGPAMFPVMKDRASVLGEFGGIGLSIKDHLWQKNNWGYIQYKTAEDSFSQYENLMRKLMPLATAGLAASVYTQTTDVEGEINGLLTYDRKVIKFPAEKLAKLNRELYKAAEITRLRKTHTLLPTSEKVPQTWSYTFKDPGKDWAQPGFDDSAWKKGQGGFGNAQIQKDFKHAKVNTAWETPALWLRRTFTFDQDPATLQAALRVFYDEDLELYLNGVRLILMRGFNTNYVSQDLDTDTLRKALKKGKNTLAIKIVNAGGGAFVDVGLDAITYE